MYPLSNAFREMLGPNGRNRIISWYGEMTTVSGTVYNIDTSIIARRSGTIRSECTQPFVGGAYSNTLQMQLFLENVAPRTLKGAKIKLYVRLAQGAAITDSTTWGDLERFTWGELAAVPWNSTEQQVIVDVPMGIFYVSDAKRTLYSIRIEAYDSMLRFDRDLPTMDGRSRSPYDWLKWMCDACGVELGMSYADVKALPNGSRSVIYASVNDRIKTYRDLLSQMASVLGSIAVIDRTGKLILRRCWDDRLYNGVSFPVLPEWDTSRRPYAAIFQYADVDYKTSNYKLIAVDSPYLYYSGENTLLTNTKSVHSFWLSADGRKWEDHGIEESLDGGYLSILEIYDGHTVVWSNADIVYFENPDILYLGESEPTYAAMITPGDRFSSSFEDKQERYTGLRAHYKAKAEQEYARNVPTLEDSGQVVDLDVNVFLQMSNNSARVNALQTIIDSLKHVSFTPFNASIPCHPEFDLLDMVEFTGGHSPERCVAPITGIVWTIGGGVNIICAPPVLLPEPAREDTPSEGLTGGTGTYYASSDFWIQIAAFPEKAADITDEAATTELLVKCTVDNTTMQIAWTGAYTLDTAGTVTARVYVDEDLIYTVSDDQAAGNHVLNVTTGHSVNQQGEYKIKVTLGLEGTA